MSLLLYVREKEFTSIEWDSEGLILEVYLAFCVKDPMFFLFVSSRFLSLLLQRYIFISDFLV